MPADHRGESFLHPFSPPKDTRGEFFLHQRDSSLQTSKEVQFFQDILRTQGKESDEKPALKISRYLHWLQDLLQPMDASGNLQPYTQERNIHRLEQILFAKKQIIIQQNQIPESYWETQRRIALEQGHGEIQLTESLKKQHVEALQEDQRSSLHEWIQYLASPDSNSFPLWAKFWAFTGVLKLGKFIPDEKRFAHRQEDTVAPYPELNREALAIAVEAMQKTVEQKNKTVNEPEVEQDQELVRLAKQGSFNRLYAHVLERVQRKSEVGRENINGEWKKFQKNSNYAPLCESLQGYSTGWCTSSPGTAVAQLRKGDFYVYYSEDEKKEKTIPRVAIRMENDRIAEVRGIDEGQNLDPYIAPVVDEKLNEFGPEGALYKKRSKDMKQLTDIARKHDHKIALSKDDLRFLYEMDDHIEGFGYKKDPRIKKIRSERDLRYDLSVISNTTPDHISLPGVDPKTIFSGEIITHYGNLKIDEAMMQEIGGQWPQHMPDEIIGDFLAPLLVDGNGKKLPRRIHGSLYVPKLQSLEGVNLPESYEDVVLDSITELKHFTFPKTTTQWYYLSRLQNGEDLHFPNTVEGIHFPKCVTLANTNLPEIVQKRLTLSSLTDLSSLRLPKSVGELDLSAMENLDGIELPQNIQSLINLSGLKSAEGLKLPPTFTQTLLLNSLRSGKDLKLPKWLHRLVLESLDSIDNMEFPDHVGTVILGIKTSNQYPIPLIADEIILPYIQSLDGLQFQKVGKETELQKRIVLTVSGEISDKERIKFTPLFQQQGVLLRRLLKAPKV